MKVKTANLKSGGIELAGVLGGTMAANAVSKLMPPIGHPIVPKATPLLAGVAGLLLSDNKHIKAASIGMMLHGTLAVANHFLRPAEVGVSGITDNPAIAKIVDLALPNLGSTEEVYALNYNNGGFVEDQGYADEIINTDFLGYAEDEGLNTAAL
ncbi:MAG: hypothetical protein R3279_07480 [Putridiphycobacter sp.]|nr:hypothetical protein [Putridiphycobacter sp.]